MPTPRWYRPIRPYVPPAPAPTNVDVGERGTSFTLAGSSAIAGGTSGGLAQQATIVVASSLTLLEVAGPSAGTTLAMTVEQTEKASVAFAIAGESVEQGSLNLNLAGALVIGAQTAIALTETAAAELRADGQTAVVFDVQGDASISDSGQTTIVLLEEGSGAAVDPGPTETGETSFALELLLEHYFVAAPEETVSSGGLPSRRPRPRRGRPPLTPALYVFGVPTTTIRLVPTLEHATAEWDETVLESEDDMLVLALAEL